MSLISLTFFAFLIVVLFLYYKACRANQWIVLLAASLVFYVWAKPLYLLILAISIITTWALCLKPNKIKFAGIIAVNLGLLIFFRYGLYYNIHSLIVPLGMSFYTFMILGYAHDCLGGKIEPEKNPLKFALFVSYFPQITQGPIGNYRMMREELFADHEFDKKNIGEGLYRILRGCFLKLVIAGRLTYYVDSVFSDPKGLPGLSLIIGVFFYTIELYADFSGYMDIACGASRLFGITLAENFMRPYLSRNIQEFWRRWHISLNEWFKEHLMLPAVTSKPNKSIAKVLAKIFPKAKKGTLRTVTPLVVVWLVTGIWHGAEDVYIGWGIYFAIIMLISVCSMNFVKKVKAKIGWRDENPVLTVLMVLKTYIIVFLGEVMFRAESMSDAFAVYKGIFTNTRINMTQITAAMSHFGNGNQAIASMLIIGIMIAGMLIVEIIKERNENAFTKNREITAAVLLVLLALLAVPGQSSFMYQAF